MNRTIQNLGPYSVRNRLFGELAPGAVMVVPAEIAAKVVDGDTIVYADHPVKEDAPAEEPTDTPSKKPRKTPQ